MPPLLTSRGYSHSSIAQSVERLTVNQNVPGSSPGGGVMKIIRDHVKSRVTWDDVIEKIELDSTSNSSEPIVMLIRNPDNAMLPSYQLKHGEASSFPGGFKDVMEELNPRSMDVYVSLSKVSELFPMHTDQFDVIISQMLGEISYAFADGSLHTLCPGDSIMIPKGVPHKAILHGPRITLSCT